MANYILKTQSATFCTIVYNRKPIGTVKRNENGTWSGTITDNNVTAKVDGFATSTNAFYAATQTLKVYSLNRRARTNLIAPNQGTGNEAEEIAMRNRSVQEYVSAYNASEKRQVLRVATRRR
ncbi:hypothetical protein D3C71_1415150 [compost metagenome]